MLKIKTCISLITLTIVLLQYGCKNEIVNLNRSDKIRINQLGYYPESPKVFVLSDLASDSFEIINQNGVQVYLGGFKKEYLWPPSGETVRIGDFSEFRLPGTYYIRVADTILSYDLEIAQNLLEDEIIASLKSYYFQRASIPILAEYGGKHSRKSGHPDTVCWYHPSTGKVIGHRSSPGGWYDAGDYGKYTCNGAISTGQLLALQETLPNIFPDNSLNIPESGNGKSDMLDELLYELNWLFTMQVKDGGVFHKLTAKKFSGFIMPYNYDLDRYLIGKGTAASLDFAAVMAQASRVYRNLSPAWSEKAVIAAERAWNWSKNHPDITFENPEGVVTGEYGDEYLKDDFFWAATELFISTGDQQYLEFIHKYNEPVIHQITNSWKYFVRNNAIHSMLLNKDYFSEKLYSKYFNGHIKLADSILDIVNSHPYAIGLNHFEWGSNSDILNQAYILCIANHLTGHLKYIEGAVKITDYIFGKNATGYCFLTGFGDKKVLFPHHRPSAADSIVDPVPGFIIGGPNHHRQDIQYVNYESEMPAKAYIDDVGSYASNEVCINWNAPAVFVFAYINNFYNKD